MLGEALFFLALGTLTTLQGLDIWSTNRFRAVGVREANPLMRFFMETLGAAWWVPKAALTLVVCAGLYGFRQVYPVACGMVLLTLVGFYIVTVWRNVQAGSR